MNDNFIQLPDEVIYIISKLENHGYCAYAVGGCVRDAILGRIPKDWDICTNAVPDRVIDVFSDDKILLTGYKYGTVTIFPKMIESSSRNECGYEITTFRKDGKYKDGRRPESVEFVSDIYTDLARRDFTINAIAYSPSTGFIDPFGGIKDLWNRILKCVGNPEMRFYEDGLRIMRALRFASVYSLSIDALTNIAITMCSWCMKKVSKERITKELLEILETADKPGEMLNLHPYVLMGIDDAFK